MFVLFVHQAATSQYQHFVEALVSRGDRVVFICETAGTPIPGVEYRLYEVARPTAAELEMPLAFDFVQATRRAEAAAQQCERLRAAGAVPDVVFGHSGWGETLYLKDVFPAVPLVNYVEFYYHAQGYDLGFDAEFDPLFLDPRQLQARNATLALSCLRSDLNTVPTAWQRQVLPAPLGQSARVLHEGVDTDEVRPNPKARFTLDDGRVLAAGDTVITYVARTLEPYRGFPTFMRALPRVLAALPDAEVVIVGAEGASYGSALPRGSSYKQMMLAEVGDRLPPSRVHFTGTVDRARYLSLLQVSAAHVYLTYPLFLSWSCIEAMAAGCLVIGSRTGPVTDVLDHGDNGWLVDFFKPEALADTLVEGLRHRRGTATLRRRARETARERFDLKSRCLPQWFGVAQQFSGRVALAA